MRRKTGESTGQRSGVRRLAAAKARSKARVRKNQRELLLIVAIAIMAISLPSFCERKYTWGEFYLAGEAAQQAGNLEEAEYAYLAAIQAAEKSENQDKTQLAQSLFNLAEVYHAQERFDEAEALYKQSLETDGDASKEANQQRATALGNLGELYRSMQRYDLAESMQRQAIAYAQRAYGEKGHEDLSTLYTNLAHTLLEQEQPDEALKLYEKALELDKKSLGEKHPYIAANYTNVAEIIALSGQYAKAEELLLQALEIYAETPGENLPQIIDALMMLGKLQSEQTRYKEAQKTFQDVKERMLKLLGERHPQLSQIHQLIANTHRVKGEFDEAEKNYKQALMLQEPILDHPENIYANIIEDFAQMLMVQSKHAQALALTKEAISKLDTMPHRDENPFIQVTEILLLDTLEQIYRGLNDSENATKTLEFSTKLRHAYNLGENIEKKDKKHNPFLGQKGANKKSDEPKDKTQK